MPPNARLPQTRSDARCSLSRAASGPLREQLAAGCVSQLELITMPRIQRYGRRAAAPRKARALSCSPGAQVAPEHLETLWHCPLAYSARCRGGCASLFSVAAILPPPLQYAALCDVRAEHLKEKKKQQRRSCHWPNTGYNLARLPLFITQHISAWRACNCRHL